MKKLVLVTVLGLVSTISAQAESDLTFLALKCTGKDVVLESHTPYLGQGRPVQTLYTLKSRNVETLIAYFLDNVVEDRAGAKEGNALMTSGTNSVGGSFELALQDWKDVGNGTIGEYATTGVLKYNHGPLRNRKGEPVNCTKD